MIIVFMSEKMASTIKKARFSPEYEKEFIRLQRRLGLELVHGGESKTLQQAIVLANKQLDLKEKIQGFFKENFKGVL